MLIHKALKGILLCGVVLTAGLAGPVSALETKPILLISATNSA
jgi:hypothetical protein